MNIIKWIYLKQYWANCEGYEPITSADYVQRKKLLVNNYVPGAYSNII